MVQNAILEKKRHALVLNYASATWYFLKGVYILDSVMNWFGKKGVTERPKNIGWILMDYEDRPFVMTPGKENVTMVDLIIASNFNYIDFEDKFSVKEL